MRKTRETSSGTMGDFRMQYYPARTLVQCGDPYNQGDVLRTYRAEGAGLAGEALGLRLMTTAYIYPPKCDAKILLLMIPACAMLHRQGGWVGRVATALTVAGLVATADIPWVVDVGIVRHFQDPGSSVPRWLLSASQLLPAPMTLLTTGGFFLWVYARGRQDRPAETVVCL